MWDVVVHWLSQYLSTESHSSCHIETLGKSLTRSCLWRFGVKLRHCIRTMSGALLSSSGLEEALQKWSE